MRKLFRKKVGKLLKLRNHGIRRSPEFRKERDILRIYETLRGFNLY